jgi:site-specific recombinase XerC
MQEALALLQESRALGKGYTQPPSRCGSVGFTASSASRAQSHSGRRTFITQSAREITQCGGSLRDVQELAGHASLATTQRYIAGDAEAKRRVVALL